MPRPTEHKSVVWVEPNFALGIVNKHLTAMMLSAQSKAIIPGVRLSQKRLESINVITGLYQDLKCPGQFAEQEYSRQQLAILLKVYRLWEAIMSESYLNFLIYARQLYEQAGPRSPEDSRPANLPASKIVTDGGFREAQDIIISLLAESGKTEHPKVAALMDVCDEMLLLKRSGIIFANNLQLAEELKEKLAGRQFKVEVLTGHYGHNQRLHQAAARLLSRGRLDFLISTSVLEPQKVCPGLTAPAVICYTLPQSLAEKQRWDSRAKSSELAMVRYIIMKGGPDVTFFNVQREERKAAQFELDLQSTA